MSEKRLIDLHEAERLTGLKRPTIYKHMSQGRFPKSVKLGSSTRWVLAEIEQYIDDRVAARDQPAAA